MGEELGQSFLWVFIKSGSIAFKRTYSPWPIFIRDIKYPVRSLSQGFYRWAALWSLAETGLGGWVGICSHCHVLSLNIAPENKFSFFATLTAASVAALRSLAYVGWNGHPPCVFLSLFPDMYKVWSPPPWAVLWGGRRRDPLETLITLSHFKTESFVPCLYGSQKMCSERHWTC